MKLDLPCYGCCTTCYHKTYSSGGCVILYYVLIPHSFTKSLKQSVPRGYNLLETAATMAKTPLTVGHRTLSDIKRSVTGTSVLSSKYWAIMCDTPSARDSNPSMWIDDSADEGKAPGSVRGVGTDKPAITDPLQATCDSSSCFVFGLILVWRIFCMQFVSLHLMCRIAHQAVTY